MPSTVNGIGTSYSGKKNRSVRHAHCHSCSRFGPLESYDTRLCFVVLFIPIIPLKRKRIVDFCPACTRHMAIDADQYEQARQLGISGGMEQYRREGTPEAALHAHGQLRAFHEYDQADAFRAEALAEFPDDAPFRAALAEHLRQASFYDEMARLHREAHAIDPDLPEARAGVASIAMAQGLLDEARQLLDYLEEPGAGRQHGLDPLYNLAGKLAAANRHPEALELYAVLVRELPDVAQRREIRDQIRRSERAVARAGIVAPDGTSLLPPPRRSLKGLFVVDGSPRTAAIAALVVVLGVAGLAISNEFIRRNRVLRVVNAGDPVQVAVDGGPPRTIAGLGEVPVAEGKHRIVVTGPVRETHDVELTSSYLDRWAKSPAWILNPGGEAVIEHETVSYSAQPIPSQSAVLVGQPFLAIPNVDYLFTDPPNSIQVDGKDKVVTKEVVRWVQGQDQGAFRQLAGSNRAAALDFAEKRIRRHPEDKGLFEAYLMQAFAADRARADAFLQAGLGRRPISIPWHRAAQAFATAAERARMTADYDATLAKEPANAAVLFLRGRIEPDADRKLDYFRRSAAADPRLPWPEMSLGSLALAAGRWDEALAHARQAESLGIDPELGTMAIHAARLALGQAGALVDEYRARLGSNQTDLQTLLFLFDALAAAGQADAIESERAGAENRLPAEARAAVGPTLRAYAAYAAGLPGPIAKFVAEGLPTVGSDLRAHLLLANGQAAAVLARPELREPEDPWTAAAIALGLALDGKDDDAKAYLDKATTGLAARSEEDGELVAMLKADEPTPLVRIRRVAALPAERALVLALLGERFPDRRDEYRREAAKYNLRRVPPYLIIRRATDGAAAPPP